VTICELVEYSRAVGAAIVIAGEVCS
jgi:hypothetical protein